MSLGAGMGVGVGREGAGVVVVVGGGESRFGGRVAEPGGYPELSIIVIRHFRFS